MIYFQQQKREREKKKEKKLANHLNPYHGSTYTLYISVISHVDVHNTNVQQMQGCLKHEYISAFMCTMFYYQFVSGLDCLVMRAFFTRLGNLVLQQKLLSCTLNFAQPSRHIKSFMLNILSHCRGMMLKFLNTFHSQYVQYRLTVTFRASV